TVNINGGTVMASDSGVGIGGSGSVTVNIDGGTVTASSSGKGASIGSGTDSAYNNVNISGGYITLSKNNSDADYIGSGADSPSTTNTVNISGGYFGDSSYTSSAVYGVKLSISYEAYENTDAATSGTYPCYVAASSSSHTHSYDTDGFCTCGGYQPATLNTDGVYEISNAGQLFWFASLVNGDTTQEGITAAVADADAILTTDIDLENKEWTSIGTAGLPYSGTFDGDGHTIKGLYINNSSRNYQGLFGYVGGGTVQNVSVSGNVTGYDYVGVVVGCSSGSTITNCNSSGTVSGNRYVGGVVGIAYGTSTGTVSNCGSDAVVSGNNYVGGVVGYNYGTVEYCINSGTVSGSGNYVGGVVGYKIGSDPT
ncbi:MAG: hypothetical protein LUF68_02235, partial [Clostridiales bacterium]|nr:hypothetical protein [Clostridiales bacterium]